SWQASSSFLNLCPGTYIAMVMTTDGCISAPTTFIINEPPELILSIDSIYNAISQSICNGQIFVTANGGTPPYLFSINGGSIGIGIPFQNVCANEYEICVLDANGCVACDSAFVGIGTSTNDFEKNAFSLYPNPVSDLLTISFNEIQYNSTYVITDMLSREVLHGSINRSMRLELNLENLKPGVYQFILRSGHSSYATSFVVE